MAMAMHESETHVALLVSPGIGHLIPVLELIKHLSLHHNLQITLFVISGGGSAVESEILQKTSSIKSLNIALLAVDISGQVEPTASFVDKTRAMMSEALKDFRSKITSMKVRPAALIVDLFGTEALGMARELGMLSYVFMTTNAWFLALIRFFPSIEWRSVAKLVRKLDEPLKIPGCQSVRFEDMPDCFPTTQSEYEDFSSFCQGFGMADGILSNTWQDLEVTSLKALNEVGTLSVGKYNNVPVYPVGPLIRSPKPGLNNEVWDWLDMQPKETVIYVSFGSGGTLTAEQVTELAWGLELSQQRFVWVVRPPMTNDAAGSYFTVGKGTSNTTDYLPEGFRKRTKERGLVVPMWAPQAEILSHSSVGGFLSHCGWNSTMESIMNGVPMIAWPLYAEQKMNAVMLTEELMVAVRLRASPSKGVVVREEIEKMVRKIMEGDNEEGKKIRERMKELQISGENALGLNGSSYSSLSQVAKDCQLFRR